MPLRLYLRMYRYLPFIVYLLLFFPVFAVFAEKHESVAISGRKLPVTGAFESDANDLSVSDRNTYLWYLISYHTGHTGRDPVDSESAKTRQRLLTYLKSGSVRHETAKIYYSTSANRVRLSQMQKMRSAVLGDDAQILDFQIAMLRAAIQGKVAPSAGCMQISRSLCDWIEFASFAEKVSSQKTIDDQDLRKIEQMSSPFVFEDQVIPFQYFAATNLPRQLAGLGFPLEAAIIARRISASSTESAARQLNNEIPAYLAMAGDYRTAISFAARTNPDRFEERAHLYFLNREYDEAAKLLTNIKPETVATEQRDPWTGLMASEGLWKSRLASAILLAGDKKKAGALFQKISSPKTEEGSLARLRMAQVILDENPKLAQTIAEDVSYIAQANDWWILEYQATVLDGWALYRLGKYYHAVINFTKAAGILKGQDKQYTDDLSRQFGMMMANRAMRPGANYNAYIDRILLGFMSRKEDSPYWFLTAWLPSGTDRTLFLDAVYNDAVAKKQTGRFFRILARLRQRSLETFKPATNPGGLTGLTSTILSADISARIIGSNKLNPKIAGPGKATEVISEPPVALLISDSAGRWYGFRSDGRFKRMEELPENKQCYFGESGNCTGAFSDWKDYFDSEDQVLVVLDENHDYDFRHLLGRSVLYSASTEAVPDPHRAIQAAGSAGLRLYGPDGCDLSFRSGVEIQSRAEFFSGNGGIRLLPETIDREKSPAYLRRFECDPQPVRLWEFDRYRGVGTTAFVMSRPQTGGSEAASDLLAFYMRLATDRSAVGIDSSRPQDAVKAFQEGISRNQSLEEIQKELDRISGHSRLVLPGIFK